MDNCFVLVILYWSLLCFLSHRPKTSCCLHMECLTF
uniref:Uncharacterized protein n=1 Tax=Anguilla anguilla TaxID=7936 RepID=A0A0E9SMN0_ANGAN